jgi:hypothetical protein
MTPNVDYAYVEHRPDGKLMVRPDFLLSETQPKTSAVMTGYEHPDYSASLAEFGHVTKLPQSGGWALRRGIPGTSHDDLIGPYPLFFCRNWHKLPDDLAEVGDNAVSFSMVTNPFAALDVELLKSYFEVTLPFKQHYVADLSQPAETFVSKSHQETVRRASKKVEVLLCENPAALLRAWLGFYSNLIERHRITGIRAFSERAFALQLSIPGLVAFEAREITTGALVGLDLWYLQGDIAYGHLAAFSDRGYELRASYATKWHVLKYFRGKARFLNLGAAAGVSTETPADNGLAIFKRGWSTETRANYFCGKILDPRIYARLVRDNKAEGVSFFPAYRQGKF